MKLFRLADPFFAALDPIWEAKGSFDSGGRWNLPGVRAIYLSATPEVCCAEKAFYTILQKVDAFELNINSPRENKKSIIDKELALVVIEVEDHLPFIDFTDQDVLDQYLKTASLPKQIVQNSRLSPYYALEGRWTQALGMFCEDQGVRGLRVCSARSNLGCNYVIFPRNNRRDHINIKSTEVVKLSALDSRKKKKFSLKSIGASKESVWVNSSSINTHIDVLNFPIQL